MIKKKNTTFIKKTQETLKPLKVIKRKKGFIFLEMGIPVILRN